MGQAPSYLALLNAIAVAEARGHRLLGAWAAVTPAAELRAVLELVAIREAEHAAAFTKRLAELGAELREVPLGRFEADLALAASAQPDREKFDVLLGASAPSAQPPLAEIFADETIDPDTGALLGRYIAESRDSRTRIRRAVAALADAPAPTGVARTAPGPDRTDSNVLHDIAIRLERLAVTLEQLRSLREK